MTHTLPGGLRLQHSRTVTCDRCPSWLRVQAACRCTTPACDEPSCPVHGGPDEP